MKRSTSDRGVAGDRSPASPRTWTAIASTAFMSGLAYTVVNDGVSAWLAARQVTPIVIGFFALCSLPYGLKWIWAPLLDRFHAPLIGRGRRRVGWLIVLGSLSAALLVAAGMAGPQEPIAAAEVAVATDATWLERQSLALDELSRGGLWGFALIVFALSVASASLDVVVDAFRTDSVARDQLGRAASVFVASFRIASLVGGAGALFVAARLGWHAAFIVAAVIMAIATITVAFAPEPSDGEPTSFLDAVLGPVRTFVRQWGITALALAAFVLMFRLPDLVGNRMVVPFLIQELGFNLEEIAWIRQFLGFGFTIAGAALGGVFPGLGLAALQALQLRAAALAPLEVVQHPLLPVDLGQGRLDALARLFHAAGDREAGLALGLLLAAGAQDLLTLRGEPGPLGGQVEAAGNLGQGRDEQPREGQGRSDHGQGQARGKSGRAHVSRVSTTRRSSARNSADCISLSRETVRGNSCDIGPSV